MAVAALQVLGLTERIAERLDPATFVPAVGQGCVAVEVRGGDAATRPRSAAIDERRTRHAVEVERTYLAELGSGCSLPARRPRRRRVAARVPGVERPTVACRPRRHLRTSSSSTATTATTSVARAAARRAHEAVAVCDGARARRSADRPHPAGARCTRRPARRRSAPGRPRPADRDRRSGRRRCSPCAVRWPGWRSFDWLVVTSVNGARPSGAAGGGQPTVRLAAVGRGDRRRARRTLAGRPVDLVPAVERAEGLLAAFPPRPRRCSSPRPTGPVACSPMASVRRATTSKSSIAYRTVEPAPTADETRRAGGGRRRRAVAAARPPIGLCVAPSGWRPAAGRGDRAGHGRRRSTLRARRSPMVAPDRRSPDPGRRSSRILAADRPMQPRRSWSRRSLIGVHGTRRSRPPGRAGCAARRRCASWSPRRPCGPADLIAPLFVREGIDEPQPDRVAARRRAAHPRQPPQRGRRAGRRSACGPSILFGVPADKDAVGQRAPSTPRASCSSPSPTCAATSATTSC